MTAQFQYGGQVRVEGFFKWDTKPDVTPQNQNKNISPTDNQMRFRQGPAPTFSEKVGSWIMNHSIRNSGLYNLGRWLKR